MSRPIHWEEGMCLQQQHLQQFQRSVFELPVRERSLAWIFPYGVIEAQLETSDLANYIVKFSKLRAIMPESGVEVDFPRNAYLAPLDLRKAFQGKRNRLRVFLALPRWSPNEPNAERLGSDERQASASPCRYSIYREEDCRDENDGQLPESINMRRLNTRLLWEGPEAEGMEHLEILRVELATDRPEARPREDLNFVPPCLVLGGSAQLRIQVDSLAAKIRSHRRGLAEKICAGGQDWEHAHSRLVENVMRLRTLNRFCDRLGALVEVSTPGKGVNPFDLYLELGEFLGELSALRLDTVEHDVARYNHDDPWPCFEETCRKITALLPGDDAEKPKPVPFPADGALFTAQLVAEDFSAESFILGISFALERDLMASHVQDSSKFTLTSRSRAERMLEGLRLRRLDWPEPGLLRKPDLLHYFWIDLRNSPAGIWEEIRTEGKISVKSIVQDQVNLGGAGFTLYLKPPSKAGRR